MCGTGKCKRKCKKCTKRQRGAKKRQRGHGAKKYQRGRGVIGTPKVKKWLKYQLLQKFGKKNPRLAAKILLS